MNSEHDQSGTDTGSPRPGEEIDNGDITSSLEYIEALSPEEIRRRFHELRVYQIELEKQNEQLRQTQEHLQIYQEIVNSIPDRVAFLDKNYRYIIVNEGYEQFNGVSPEQLVGLKPADIMGEDVFQRLIKPHFDRCLKGEIVNYQDWFDYPSMGKRFIDVNYYPYRDSHNNINGIVAHLRDITEHKQAAEIILGFEERYRLLFNSSLDAFLLTTPDGGVLAANPAACKMLDRTQEEIKQIGREGIMDITDPRLELALEQRSKTGRFSGELTCIRRNGAKFPAEVSSTIYADKDGNTNTCIIVRDITARKQAEEQLRRLNEELELRVEERTRELQETQRQYLHAEKLSTIGKLSASIAHEFNNPLQGLRTILKGLKRRAILEEEDKELLDLAISENERMKNLIKSLQDFNKPSAGQKMAMDVHAALDYLLLLCKSDFKRKRISTVRKYAEGFPLITVIPDQLKQVLLNLLNNAADACSEKGGVITITTYHDNQKVVIAIQDTGVGVEYDNKNTIFEPFFTTKTKEKGTGLGLSICWDIIQHHQGEIRVESERGKGSTFTILLPTILKN